MKFVTVTKPGHERYGQTGRTHGLYTLRFHGLTLEVANVHWDDGTESTVREEYLMWVPDRIESVARKLIRYMYLTPEKGETECFDDLSESNQRYLLAIAANILED